jgi:hypothetical protein
VHGVVQGPDLDDKVDDPAQRCRQSGFAQRPIGAIGQHNDVGPQLVGIFLQKPAQVRRGNFLLTLDEHRDRDRRLALPGPQGGGMHGNSGLVIGGATAK